MEQTEGRQKPINRRLRDFPLGQLILNLHLGGREGRRLHPANHPTPPVA